MSKGKDKRQRSKSKKGLFDDLESLTDSEIDDRTKTLKASIEANEKELVRIKQERDAEITLVQSLRVIQESSRGLSKERNSLLTEFRKIREQAKKVKAERDDINENIPPPLEIIEQRLVETHRRLATIPNDLSMMPNQGHETKLFSFFFELKAMHSRKSIGNNLHQKYIDLLRKQEEKLKQLDKLNAEKKAVAEDAREEVADQKANPKEIRKLNERIAKMLEEMKKHRAELKKMRREIGRLEAFARVRRKENKGDRKNRRIGLRLEDVKARASSGESLSLEDFSALMNSGGLESLADSKEADEKSKSDPVKSRRRKVGASRGRRRTLNSEEREKRQR
ncbi:MAG: hypothetical protein VX473_07100 [Candidatus Thermoplasmatota archaeon]|nr:hypothetical protein [Candidatus Thermoplasmatota archaeon]